jgi:kynurenine formamidase
MSVRTRLLTILLVAVPAVSCAPASPEARPAPIDASRVVDLSYTYDEGTIYWPNAEGFRHRKDQWAINDAGFWYAAGDFASAEHGGTHLDSPVHFAEGEATVDEIPLADLIGPAAVIDVSARATADRDYRVTPDDITDWEAAYGRLTPDTIVIVRTGWGSRWPDRLAYMGNDTPGDTSDLHFPGLSMEAAELLVERDVRGVGIDTASLDHGPSTDFIAHQILNGAGIYGLENIANAETLPPVGSTLIALPMKIGEGTGAPTRVIAFLP